MASPIFATPTYTILTIISLLLLLAHDVEINPGPRKPKFPCGECGRAVRNGQRSVACDTCDTWYHSSCINMNTAVHDGLRNCNCSWHCFRCGLPHFSSGIFTTTLVKSSTHPSLNISSPSSPEAPPSQSHGIGHPIHQSSPIHPSDRDIGNQQPTSPPPLEVLSSISSTSDGAPDPLPVNHSQSLRTLVINFQSVKNKAEDLNILITNANPDIIIGCETWLEPSIHTAEFLPSNYHAYRKDRDDGFGGVLIATRNTFITHQLKCDTSAEVIFVHIETENKNCPLIVGSVYRPPCPDSEKRDTKNTDLLQAISQSYVQSNAVVWIGGDFNLPDVRWDTCEISGNSSPKATNHAFLKRFSDLGLHQLVTEPTRQDNTLDLFLTNRPSLSTRCSVIPGLGDHDVVLIDSRVKPVKTKTPPRTIHLWKKADVEQIKNDTKIFSDNLLTSDKSVEDTWQEVHRHLSDMMERHVPSKQASTKFHQPWINTKLKRAARRKRRAWRKARRTNNSKDIARYKRLKRAARRLNRQAYRRYMHQIVTEDNRRNLFRLIKAKKCDSVGVAPLKHEGLTVSGSESKANILNEQFCSVFTDEDLSSLPAPEPGPYPDMPDIQISQIGVTKLLKTLNPRKAPGPDGIPGRLLSMVSDEISPALTLLFTKSLSTAQVPSAWRHAFVQPIFKKGDRSLPANYRPISLTSICCKMLEHIVRSELTGHLDRNNILSDAQHGFRKGRSCESQLTLTVNDLVEELDRGGQTDAILLDFSKAFDRVPHQRLLWKLHHYGIRGQTLAWIRSFLADRTQQVLVEGEKSSVGKVTSGVPQGSVLGPSLFLVYINDLCENITAVVRLFADDTILYRSVHSHRDAASLQEDLARLESWEARWQMGFNVEKCHVLTVTRKREPILTTYTLHGQPLGRVDSAKYLGVEISNNLHWGKHVHAVSSKAHRTSCFIARNLKGCPAGVQTHCFKAIARPILEYASSVWDPHQDNLIKRLEGVQKRTARRITGNFDWSTSSSTLVSELQLQPLRVRRQVDKAVLMYKVVNSHVDWSPPEGLLTTISRTTRGHSQKLRVPHSRTNSHLHSFFPSATRLWNSLPAKATTAGSIAAFRNITEGWLGAST